MLSFIVSFKTQGSWAAYATPCSLGRLNQLSRLSIVSLSKCNSPSKANNKLVLPEPVGPMIKLNACFLKNKSPSILSLNLRLEGVAGVEEPNDDEGALQVKDVLWKPIFVGSAFGGRKEAAISGAVSDAGLSSVKRSSSSVLVRNSVERSGILMTLMNKEGRKAETYHQHDP